MITLTSLSKIYRTNEIETVALENVNLKLIVVNSLALWDLPVVANRLY